jgi:hypothetical protein
MTSDSTLGQMRFSILVTGITFNIAAQSAAGQQAAPSPLRQLEKEMMARISERAIANGGFRFGAGELDLRLPLAGEPQEIIGPSLHANGALAVGSARVEPLDSIMSRDSTFHRAQYELRLEDRKGNCLVVHSEVTMDSVLVRGRRTAERCQPLYMAEVIHRARRIARLPFAAGRLDDHWSAALAAKGTADVYLDSIVITTTDIAVRASYPSPATEIQIIDSVSAGLGLGDKSWSVAVKSAAIPVDTTLRKNGEWRRKIERFTIPIDSSFALSKSWPLFEVYLRVPKTAGNPLGVAWTYAHERKGFFEKLR